MSLLFQEQRQNELMKSFPDCHVMPYESYDEHANSLREIIIHGVATLLYPKYLQNLQY